MSTDCMADAYSGREVDDKDVIMAAIKNDSLSGKPKSSGIRSLVIEAAKKLSDERSQQGLIAALSPTPHEFIELILSDEIFSKTFQGVDTVLMSESSERNNVSGKSAIHLENNEKAVESRATAVNSFINSDEGCPTGTTRSLTIIPENTVAPVTQPLQAMVDFGCGDGRWLIAFQKKFNCLSFGVEKDLKRFDICRQMIIKEDEIHNNVSVQPMRSKIELILGDFSNFCCTGVAAVIVFLSRDGNESIKDKLERECMKNAIIVAVGVSTAHCTLHEHFDPVGYFILYAA
jgi:hypothetical protein